MARNGNERLKEAESHTHTQQELNTKLLHQLKPSTGSLSQASLSIAVEKSSQVAVTLRNIR